MHTFLNGLDSFTQELPLLVEKPFTQEQIQGMRDVLEENRANPLGKVRIPGEHEEYRSDGNRFDPRIMKHMSRMVIEFVCPKDSEEVMDKYVKPLYNGDIRLTHYSYLDYNPKYGEGEYLPSLPPHVDSANTLVTFNYCLDGNIDWDVVIDGKAYELKPGDALLFSAVNQVHWRPKRKWKEGDFMEILTFDYSPPDDWRFTHGVDPLDQTMFPEEFAAYIKDLHSRPELQAAWNQYNAEGREIGIPDNLHGDWE